jgi:WD40 repeat protein
MAVIIFSVAIKADGSIELAQRLKGCETLAWVCDIKFSPDDALLACGAHDKTLYCFDVSTFTALAPDKVDWKACDQSVSSPEFKFKKHSSAVLHFDFSRDNMWLQTNCQAYELLYVNLLEGTQETSPSKLADYNGTYEVNKGEDKVWHTQTCVLGWAVMGIWPPGVDGTEINSVDRSPRAELLATGDDTGNVKLFRNPSAVEQSAFKAFTGHSSHVTTVRWCGDDYLLSVGGNDRCVFVWRKQSGK